MKIQDLFHPFSQRLGALLIGASIATNAFAFWSDKKEIEYYLPMSARCDGPPIPYDVSSEMPTPNRIPHVQTYRYWRAKCHAKYVSEVRLDTQASTLTFIGPNIDAITYNVNIYDTGHDYLVRSHNKKLGFYQFVSFCVGGTNIEDFKDKPYSAAPQYNQLEQKLLCDQAEFFDTLDEMNAQH